MISSLNCRFSALESNYARRSEAFLTRAGDWYALEAEMIDMANVPAGCGRRRSKSALGEQKFTSSGILS